MSRVLVVDDEPDLRYILRRIFEGAGHEVMDAGDGADALVAVQASTPDLIVTDMMMPVMDGTELIRRLRADATTATILILALTGSSHLGGAADMVVAKPCDPERIIVAAGALLAQTEGRR